MLCQLNKKTKATFPGYTLLEVMLSMAIVLVFLVAVVPVSTGLLQEGRLRDPANQLETMARRARNLSIIEESSYRIVLGKDSMRLLSETGIEKANYTFSDSIDFLWKSWGDKDWKEVASKDWRFLSTGLCEPLSVRFQLGDSVLIQNYNPLTAAVRKEEYEIL